MPLQKAWPGWMEAVWCDDDGTLFGWYHTEPDRIYENSTLTAPRIGAVVSFDGGQNFFDLGIVLESGDPLDENAQNGYFAGGNGDFSVILDRERKYFYFFFGNYGGPAENQGVAVARMAFEDRFVPVDRVQKYYAGEWNEPGLGGRLTPIFTVRRPWQSKAPDALWGPSVHWNTYLNSYVMLLNHARGQPGWSQAGIFISFATDLTQPETWKEPTQILDNSDFPGWYYFYPQVMGLGEGETDTLAGQNARLYVGGISRWEIEFSLNTVEPVEPVNDGETPPEETPPEEG
ncbi:MAG: hypothetical protein HZA31_07690 [Opitutae bacterium]|nr:hypothetical protein [Opitutae bacterium]